MASIIAALDEITGRNDESEITSSSSSGIEAGIPIGTVDDALVGARVSTDHRRESAVTEAGVGDGKVSTSVGALEPVRFNDFGLLVGAAPSDKAFGILAVLDTIELRRFASFTSAAFRWASAALNSYINS